MQTKFTTSINIERDFDKDLKYIPTTNATSIFNQLVNSFQTGVHSFNIIGSYGTGKSSFIVALEKNLSKGIEYFVPISKQFNGLRKFHFVNIVGEYTSLENVIQKKIGLNKKQSFFDGLNKFYIEKEQNNELLVFVIDEFGKFLEYASKHNPEKELYFIQQFAEFVNDVNRNALLITTLHQDFSTYSNTLSLQQKKEWDKVKGRFKELAFNEPIEQLLFLAADYIEGKEKIPNKESFNTLFNNIKSANIIPLSQSINLEVAEKFYPLDLLSASVLTLALQRYGQNERSLFSFLQANDESSLSSITEDDTFYSLNNVFNYLTNNFYSLFNTPLLNPDERQWSSIREAVEKIEGFWSENIENAVQIVQTIGLLNIFSTFKSKINRDFLASYAELSLNIPNAIELIEELEQRKIIRYAKYRSQYILASGTDMDINKEILEAGASVDKNTDIVKKLQEHVSFPFVAAKAVQYETGTPRFFEFKISEQALSIIPTEEIDGCINIIINEKLTKEELIKLSEVNEEAVMYALFLNSKSINEILFEIDKIDYVVQNRTSTDDRVALKELNRQKNFEISKLNSYIVENLFGNENIVWFFKGQEIILKDKTAFNKYLSVVIKNVYNKTAIYKNESVNKHKISATISSARKKFTEALINNWDKENLGIKKFPPEKAVYLTLLKNTGIHKGADGFFFLDKPDENSGFIDIWNACEEFFETAKNRKRNLIELIELLSAKPYKLKQGLIDFWLPLYLFIRRDDYALFYQDNYIPTLKVDIFDLIFRSIKGFSVKTYDIDGLKLELFNEYRRLIDFDVKEKATQKSLTETIKPFLLFYKQLPDYARTTKDLSRNALRLRDAIAKAKEPVETFFDDFPQALGFNELDLRNDKSYLSDFIKHLKETIKELRTCLSTYVDSIELLIKQEFNFKEQSFIEYKKVLINRYKPINISLLSGTKKTFLHRLRSPIEDKAAWIDSLTLVLMGKKLEQIKDVEKNMLSEKLIDAFRELDNIIPVHKEKAKTKSTKDKVIKFDITTEKGTKTNQFIISKNKVEKVENLETKLLSLLKEEKDSLIQKAAIIQILQNKIK